MGTTNQNQLLIPRIKAVGSATWDAASLVDGAGETKSVTVTGAAIGDFVLASMGVDLVDMTMTAYVQAADTVEVRIQNESTATVDLASTTLKVLVIDGNSGS